MGDVTTTGAVIQLVTASGLTGALILALIGAYRGWWIPGPLYRERVADYERRIKEADANVDQWRSVALTSLGAIEHAIEHAIKAISGDKSAPNP